MASWEYVLWERECWVKEVKEDGGSQGAQGPESL